MSIRIDMKQRGYAIGHYPDSYEFLVHYSWLDCYY